MSVVITEVLAEYEAHYLKGEQNAQRLMSLFRQRTATPSVAKKIMTGSTIWQGATSEMTSAVQAFQKQFTPKGDVEFKPSPIPLYHMKADFSCWPDEISESWLGFFEDLEDNERKNWPLIRYIMEMELLPQIQQDLEMSCYYKGVAVAPTPGTAGLTLDAMQGLRQILRDGRTAGKVISLNSIGTVTASNIFDKVEEIVDDLDQALEGVPILLKMSPYWVRKYLRDKRNTHGTDVNYDSNKLSVDFFDNVKIVGLPSMAGTDDIVLTPAVNFKHVTRTSSKKKFIVEGRQREVLAHNDWWEGIGYHYQNMVYYYDGDGSGSGSTSGSVV